LSTELILFLSVFLGIIVGGIIGAISLVFLNIFNKFLKRKDVISSILIEVETNLSINNVLETRLEESRVNFERFSEFSEVDVFFKYNSFALANYFKDLYLILDRDVIERINALYTFSDFFILNLKTEMFKIGKKYLEFLEHHEKDYEEYTKEYNDMVKKIKKNKSTTSSQLKSILEKLIDTTDKLIDTDKTIISSYIDNVLSWVINYKKDARQLRNKLRKAINLKFLSFARLLFLNYFCKINNTI